MNGAEMTAGSIPTLRAKSGISAPMVLAHMQMPRSVRPTTGDARTRGKGAKARGGRPAVGELAHWLRNRPGVEAVALKAFAVEPAVAP